MVWHYWLSGSVLSQINEVTLWWAWLVITLMGDCLQADEPFLQNQPAR